MTVLRLSGNGQALNSVYILPGTEKNCGNFSIYIITYKVRVKELGPGFKWKILTKIFQELILKI